MKLVKLRNGHAPNHVRDAFCAAVDAFNDWKPGEPEPTVQFEVDYKPRQMLISQICGLLWNCTDIIPGEYFRYLAGDLEIGRQTYAACARAMHAYLRRHQKKAA